MITNYREWRASGVRTAAMSVLTYDRQRERMNGDGRERLKESEGDPMR